MTRTLLSLLLLSASSLVAARDVRMHDANGDGGSCTNAISASTPALTFPSRSGAVPAHRGKAKAPTSFRSGGDDEASHAPRWHSFLPGMFR